MCIEKKDFEVLSEAVADVKKDTGNIKGKIKSIDDRLGILNSRTKKVEEQVEDLEDEELRTVRCIQNDTIAVIKENMLTIDKFEEWERKKEKAKKDEIEKIRHEELVAVKHLEAKQRKMQWVVALIVGVGMTVVSLITIFSNGFGNG